MQKTTSSEWTALYQSLYGQGYERNAAIEHADRKIERYPGYWAEIAGKRLDAGEAEGNRRLGMRGYWGY